MATIRTPATSGSRNLALYLKEVWQVPLLTDEEARTLASRWRDNGDIEAAHRLVTSHLRFVVKIAMRYRNHGLPISDLISEGNIGLMKAVVNFEPERGFGLSTYARWWIKAAILEFILQSWSLVRVGSVAAQKKLFFKLSGLKRTLEIPDEGELSPGQAQRLSEATDLPIGDIVRINRRLAGRDLSLNAPVTLDVDAAEFGDTLADEKPSAEEVLAARQEAELKDRLLASAVASLSEREHHVFHERYLREDRPTLKQLGKHLGISHERVRQLEKQAIKRIRVFVANWKLAESNEDCAGGFGRELVGST